MWTPILVTTSILVTLGWVTEGVTKIEVQLYLDVHLISSKSNYTAYYWWSTECLDSNSDLVKYSAVFSHDDLTKLLEIQAIEHHFMEPQLAECSNLRDIPISYRLNLRVRTTIIYLLDGKLWGCIFSYWTTLLGGPGLIHTSFLWVEISPITQ